MYETILTAIRSLDLSAAEWSYTAILLALLIREVIGLLTKRKGDTLSEFSWRIRRHFVGRLLSYTLLTWLWWHLVFGRMGGLDWRDALFVGFGIVLAIFVRPNPSPKSSAEDRRHVELLNDS